MKAEKDKEREMYALSIRQPWAWLIIHAGKDIENREWATAFRGDVLIHASKTMTLAEYEAAVIFCMGLPDGTIRSDLEFPTYDELKAQCGGIVGRMTIVDCVKDYRSPWFCGPYGFVVVDAMALQFSPCRGSLKFFIPDYSV